MATLTFNGESYTVDHAVKGSNYVHGYDVNGICVVAFENVEDLTAITYDGTYMLPENCSTEKCNTVVYCGGKLQTLGGDSVGVKRADLANDALYSPMQDWISTRIIVVEDIGKTMKGSWNEATTLTLTQANSTQMPSGAEIAVIRYGNSAGADVTITSEGTRFVLSGNDPIYQSGTTLKISEAYGMIALKKISSSSTSGDLWLVTGNVEVV